MSIVGFDFGQTLAELDYEFLQTRLLERGARLDATAARAASTRAVMRYGELKAQGHATAWRGMVEVLLQHGSLADRAAELCTWLWDQQPRRNLWRHPIPGMIELVRELRRAHVAVAIISNSEGHLAELVSELGWAADFDVVVDSGRLGIDKPQPGIFQEACRALAQPCSALIHVGDSWEADVEGALGVGAQAVWFDSQHRQRTLASRVHGAANAAELREVLARLGLLS